ncbi:hypothetical protein [Atopobacter phocae]|uniref:hypothetical protein n=1 Tax=Atopobacter phocae TaxID=136492 RepID=UPI000470BD00|nr:hypothetical protein [Atopobacter phocae]
MMKNGKFDYDEIKNRMSNDLKKNYVISNDYKELIEKRNLNESSPGNEIKSEDINLDSQQNMGLKNQAEDNQDPEKLDNVENENLGQSIVELVVEVFNFIKEFTVTLFGFWR